MPMLNQKYCRFCGCPVPWDYVESKCRTEVHPNRGATYAHHECFDLWTEANKPRVKAVMDEFEALVEKEKMEVAGSNCPNCNEPFQDDDTVIAGKHLVCPSTIMDAKSVTFHGIEDAPKQSKACSSFATWELGLDPLPPFTLCINCKQFYINHNDYMKAHLQPKLDNHRSDPFIEPPVFEGNKEHIDTSVYVPTCKELGHCNHKGCDQPLITRKVLELIVIDLGDSCVVRVVKGAFTVPMAHTFNKNKSTVLSGHTFEQLKQAIDGDAPVPRLERGVDDDGNHIKVIGNSEVTQFGEYAYEVLCEIAGKPLPIYNGGRWEQLATEPIAIWRYYK